LDKRRLDAGARIRSVLAVLTECVTEGRPLPGRLLEDVVELGGRDPDAGVLRLTVAEEAGPARSMRERRSYAHIIAGGVPHPGALGARLLQERVALFVP